MTFQMKHWSFLPAPEEAALSSGKKDGCRLEEPIAHTCSAVKMAYFFFFLLNSPENKSPSLAYVCMTHT